MYHLYDINERFIINTVKFKLLNFKFLVILLKYKYLQIPMYSFHNDPYELNFQK